ncbi:hypothetical protein [Paraflavitalea sp. CAU 1676]|uniref:hypothetical protein n=1 Tax=Paraflavitalea sp. CAU 1676 TaxID=3032598 RepID=UPI0023DC5FB6|nr:hypothetical protein [Paraflavitalea sp. CAU 1676]MDF2189280.1 hypothetical protein [Paraflavitalea sp. CAU 1676]
MAQNILDIAICSPLKFVEEDLTQPAKYNTKYFEDFLYEDTIPDFYSKQCYRAIWQKNDNIPLQILSNYAPHNLQLYDCNDDPVSGASFVFNHIPSSIEGTGQKALQVNLGLNTYEEGYFRYRLRAGDPVLKTYVSEWFHLKEKHEGSILLEYWHDENDLEVVWETGIKMNFRVQGGFPPEKYKPGSNRTVFIDQPNNITQLSARSFSVWKLLLGDSFGLPQWVIERINEIFNCSTVLIDGKQFVASEGAELEAITEEEYPLAGWSLDVRPAKASAKKRFEVDGNIDGALTVVYNIEGKGFGTMTGSASTNIIQIQSL